ncbi:hypothetical protein OE88DRAFT_1533177 [Heliocybe sulcata]|uniref:Uncharacterized protein n=1 Tax=Heliocybe sulcata TaxID=5364 RepID=A0A5C3N2S4_9AGAM|nr:hypothetical protein OE88DRAFT_1533177 [Heliocybe sulcata]
METCYRNQWVSSRDCRLVAAPETCRAVSARFRQMRQSNWECPRRQKENELYQVSCVLMNNACCISGPRIVKHPAAALSFTTGRPVLRSPRWSDTVGEPVADSCPETTLAPRMKHARRRTHLSFAVALSPTPQVIRNTDSGAVNARIATATLPIVLPHCGGVWKIAASPSPIRPAALAGFDERAICPHLEVVLRLWPGLRGWIPGACANDRIEREA